VYFIKKIYSEAYCPLLCILLKKYIHTQQVSHLNNQFNRFTLLMSPPKTLITWLQTNKFLAFSMKCEQCGTDCVIYVRMYATTT